MSTETQDKPEKNDYKGDIADLASLDGMPFLPLEILDREAGSIANLRTTKFPSLVIFKDITESYYGSDYFCVEAFNYLKDFVPTSYHIKKSKKIRVKILTGRQGDKMLAAFNKYRLENMGRFLEYHLSIGTDPEMFVEDKNGIVIPAFSFLGSKEHPKHRTSSGAKVYWDGFQAEFDVPSATCLAYLVDEIQYGLKTLYDAAKRHNKDARLSINSLMEIPDEMLSEANEEHVALGCAPSKNVYGLRGQSVPPRQLPFRPAGGHLHFGVGKMSEYEVSEVVKSLDAILGVACVSLFAKFDNPIRRKFYGLPGEYRLPPHGLEYRTLSNAWLMHPVITHMIFELARKALMVGKSGFRNHWKATEEEVIHTITNCDVEKARQILRNNEEMFRTILSSAHLRRYDAKANKWHTDEAYNAFLNSAENIIKDPADIVDNWLINGGWATHSEAPLKNWAHSVDTFYAGKKV